jgi:hypothetical protein
MAGCQESLAPADRPPEIPVYVYNADVRAHDLRFIVTSLAESERNELLVEEVYPIGAHTKRRLATVDAERFKLHADLGDAGTGSAAIEVAPDEASYSPAGYLFVIDSEKVDGSQLQVVPLAPESESARDG